MKRFRLSSSVERITAGILCAVLAVLMGLLLFVLRRDPLALTVVGLAALLVAAGLVFYLMSLLKAACEPDASGKTVTVRGILTETIDLSQAVSLKTVPGGAGPVSTRNLVFSDSRGEPVASVPTFFTARGGAMAEPLAQELALALNISFVPSLEPWEYDRKLRAEHEKEEAQARSEAHKATFQALKAKIFPGKREERPAPALSEEEETAPSGYDMASDGINYDAMDDER